MQFPNPLDSSVKEIRFFSKSVLFVMMIFIINLHSARSFFHTRSMALSVNHATSKLRMLCKPSIQRSSSATTNLIRNSPNFNHVRLFSATPSNNPSEPGPNDNLSLKDKAKQLWKSYGYVAVGSYLGLYIATLTSIFLSLDFDIFHAETFGFKPEEAVLKVCGIFEAVTGSKALPEFIRENPKVGTFALAWVMTKFTEPIRLGVTIAAVPKIAKLFGRTPNPSTAAATAIVTSKLKKAKDSNN